MAMYIALAVIAYVLIIVGLAEADLFADKYTYYIYFALIVVAHTIIIFYLGRILVSTLAYPYNNQMV